MKSGVIIRKYEDKDLADLKEIFFSNVPQYFYEFEWPEFSDFLKDDLNEHSVYDVMLLDDKIVGSGGIALNEDNVVHMTWGMINAAKHKTGLGKKLLTHRLNLAQQLFPEKTIGLSTTQHTFGFFEKYGFVTIDTQKDFWAKGLDLYKMILKK